MLARDPKLALRDLLNTEWEKANTPLNSDPRIHTGWYDYSSSFPQVTVTNVEESTVGGGNTGVTALTGDGGIAKVRAGTAIINCWAGTRKNLVGQGSSGGDPNPKEVAYQMAREAVRILDEAQGTTNPDTGDPELLSTAGDGGRDLVDTETGDPVFRYEVTARFTYAQETTP